MELEPHGNFPSPATTTRSATLGRIGHRSCLGRPPPFVTAPHVGFLRFYCCMCMCMGMCSGFIGEHQFAFSPELDEERIGEVALEYARWMLQVGLSQGKYISTRCHEEFSRSHIEPMTSYTTVNTRECRGSTRFVSRSVASLTCSRECMLLDTVSSWMR